MRPAPLPMPGPVKAVWVARFHYHYPDDVRAIIRNCAELGFNTVLWQVRGDGTAMYRSRIEPWSGEYNHRDPGFDPLAVAVEEAHKHGLRLEAWVNVMPGWRGPKPPPMQNQLHYTHPEWFLHDSAGKRQPLSTLDPKTNKPTSFYVILNPCLPEVRRYITSVVEEIVTRYDVDGVHLDYVRYAWETTKNAAKLYPRDAKTLALYRRQTGKSPDDSPTDWDHWRMNQLTRLVSDIRDVIERRRSGATLTAAVIADPARAFREHFQNAPAWLSAGLVDALMPMAYTTDADRFSANVRAYRRAAPQGRIIPGLGIYKHAAPAPMRAQLERCQAWGGEYALFSYDSLLSNHTDRAAKKPNPQRLAQRRTRLNVLRSFNGH